MEEKHKNRVILWAILIAVSFMWGLSFIFSDYGLEHVSTVGVLAIRWTIAGLLFFILGITKVLKMNFKGKPKRALLVSALFQPCIYAILELIGIGMTTTSESTLLIALAPTMVIIETALIKGEHHSWKVNAAIGICFLGIATSILFAPNFELGGRATGYLFLIAAVIVGAYFTIRVQDAYVDYTTMEVTACMSVCGGIWFNVLSIINGNFIEDWTAFFTHTESLWSIGFLGICCSFLCYWGYNEVLSRLPQGIAVAFQNSGVTIVGVSSGIILAGDPFGWFTIVGLLLIIGGVCIISIERQKEM
ncbi:MAG: DMT family transporter [Clostridia bacterium]|nr:DMT family transporter [Clostridia bacterium]